MISFGSAGKRKIETYLANASKKGKGTSSEIVPPRQKI